MTVFLQHAQQAADAGIEFANTSELKLTIVVLDISGTPCVVVRMDGAQPITYDIAFAKANTARAFYSSTVDLKDRIKPENKLAISEIGHRIAFLGGGLPIVCDGDVIGAVGVSGATEELDVQCAAACLAAFMKAR